MSMIAYKKRVTVYDFREEPDMAIYGFDQTVPVLIWDGDLEIDFAEICEEIGDLYEEIHC